MRSDTLGARTWLLLVIAGWALLAWVLALAGMGRAIAPLADDPALVQRLPVLPPQAPERLGPADQYAAIGQRPVFAPDRQPHPFFLEGQGEAAAKTSFDYVLTSVLITPTVRLAILQKPGDGGPASAVRVRVGEAPAEAPAWHLTELAPRQAVFDGPEGQRTLALRVFDGQGGQPPTALSSGGRPPPAGMQAGQPPRSSPVPPPPTAPAQAQNQARNAAQAGASANAAAGSPAQQASAEAPVTPEQQMQAIRERIEARRRQLREQQGAGAPTGN
ncbi:general secretion pathway protein GspN [Pseudoxanthomonas winnipegensis]|uniref:General secretion pathway protein GspN n=1 Tax=Pseudoxanthomonas winnipegensis TaxID=2480810 RepID=A0A4Q8M4J0_9GAMM|nr:general secretion pathway protein GspN [Pseudoxanthomonas winnipegensis]TAA44593.1 general secretion pathway protein GspN [Pseudoxanthomonas winnipegensis]